MIYLADISILFSSHIHCTRSQQQHTILFEIREREAMDTVLFHFFFFSVLEMVLPIGALEYICFLLFARQREKEKSTAANFISVCNSNEYLNFELCGCPFRIQKRWCVRIFICIFSCSLFALAPKCVLSLCFYETRLLANDIQRI